MTQAPPPSSRHRLTDLSEHQIRRIDNLTASGRAMSFTLLVFLAFALGPAIAVEDIDFFDETRSVEIAQLGNTTIPTFTYFVFSPIVVSIFYCYMHFNISKISEALALPRPKINGVALEAQLKPWLLNDMLLRKRKDCSIEARPLDAAADFITFLLLWCATPVIITIFWVRSWTAHDLLLSAINGICLAITLFVGATTWLKARRDIAKSPVPNSWTLVSSFIACLAAIIWLTVANSKGILEVRSTSVNQGIMAGVLPLIEPLRALGRMEEPDLSGARLSSFPPSQSRYAVAKERYRYEFCRRRGVEPETCDRLDDDSHRPAPHVTRARSSWCEARGYLDQSDCDAQFKSLAAALNDGWSIHRSEAIAQIAKPDLTGRDLRRTTLNAADLIGVSFRDADLRETILKRSHLEAADLSGANLTGADLSAARLTNANLSGAVLGLSTLLGTELSNAVMPNANADSATIQSASFFDTDAPDMSFVAATVLSSDLRRINAPRSHFDHSTIEDALFQNADLSFASFVSADIRGSNLDGADFRHTTIDRSALSEVNANDTDFSGAVLTSADVSGTLKRARFSGATIAGTDFHQSDMRFSDWTGAVVGASLMHEVDLRGATGVTQGTLRWLIGDEWTLLPASADDADELFVATCWPEEPPGWDSLVEALKAGDGQPGSRRTIMTEAQMRDAFICAPGVEPRRTGTPWPTNRQPPWVTDAGWRPQDRGPLDTAVDATK